MARRESTKSLVVMKENEFHSRKRPVMLNKISACEISRLLIEYFIYNIHSSIHSLLFLMGFVVATGWEGQPRLPYLPAPPVRCPDIPKPTVGCNFSWVSIQSDVPNTALPTAHPGACSCGAQTYSQFRLGVLLPSFLTLLNSSLYHGD